jgi:hypothetical protein
MEIRFISSLTAEDENAFAPALLKAMGALLDQLPIAYTMRIETIGAQVFQHASGGAREPELVVPRPGADAPRLTRHTALMDHSGS